MNTDRDTLIFCTVLVVAFLCFLLGAAIPSVPEPLERWSGYEWQQMSPEQRVYYTAGLMTGLWYGAQATKVSSEPRGAAEARKLFVAIAAFLDSHTLAEATSALESYYLYPKLQGAPIVYAVVELGSVPYRNQ